ncbi:MAG TPA: ABC transporter substrate-binding protein [Clostridiales bacterium]|nr:ABC transporter substrate-binding protein [Clostridiales bacterium]
MLLRLRTTGRFALVLVLAGTTLLAMAGCELRLTRPGVTIVVWDGPRWADESGNHYHWVQRKIEEFEATHPFVEVIFVPVEWSLLRPMLDAAKNAGELPDIAPFDLSAGGVTLEEIDEGLLEPVDGFLEDPDDLSPQARQAYTYDGRLWGFPSSMTGHVLLLNLHLFEERGVELPPGGRWTWEEFLEACRRLTFDRDGDGNTDVWGFATYVLPGYYEVWPFLYASGARPVSGDLTTYTFNSESAVGALDRLVDLVFEENVAHPSTGTSSVRTVFNLFADPEQQQVAIEPWSAWAIDYLTVSEQAIKNFTVAAYPTMPIGGSADVGEAGTPGAGEDGSGSAALAVWGGEDGPLTIGGTGGFVVFRQEDPHRRSLVMELANYLTSTAAQYELARGYHAFPARRSAPGLGPFAGEPAYERAAEIVFRAESLPPHSRRPEIERLIQRQIQMVLLGIKNASEALQHAGEAVAELLAEPEEEGRDEDR